MPKAGLQSFPRCPIGSDESDFGSQELRSDYSSSEDENSKIGYIGPPNPKKRRRNRPGVRIGENDNVVNWHVGMKFASMQEFRDVVREYGIKDIRGIQLVTNDALRCQVCCEADCRFYMWCSKDKDSDNCTIKTLFPEHNCTKPYTNKLATVKIKILRVRKAALEGVQEALREHYSRLRDFAHEILKTNSNNTVQIRTTRLNETDANKFKWIYICYDALKKGWKAGCRPVIGFDGCFLKTVCGGQLLSAVGRDGNNQMFPIAYVVVEIENTDSWKWFTELLSADLNLGDGDGYTVISDQQKGLDNALKEVLQRVEHRFCTRHIYSNLRKRFPSLAVKRAFWNACCATHPVAHQRSMKDLQKTSKAAHDQLSKLDPKLWSKAFFSTHSKADNVENNMSECFNAWIINER
ncbi:uncharacterized protein LOC141705338 [Apium graveolens]|uniref:uncharacterized protein LOC141705338 n=1 Tax=Apium graveolens TaxID=4045 RepID=UPI003D7C01F8